MLDMNYFRAIQNATGANYTQDIVIAEAKREFEEGFEGSVNLKRNVKIGDRLQEFIFTITKVSDVCKIMSRPNESFDRGELLEYENDFWLVIEKNIENDIYSRGEIQKCNHLLIWQNPETFEIIERWSIAKDPYTSGEDRNSVVATGSGKFKIKLPYDDETKLLKRDKRFLMDYSGGEPVAYRLVRFDGVTNSLKDNNEGFLVINVDEDELQDGDNKDLMIANYKPPPTPQPEPIGKVAISHSGNPELRVGGNAKTFKAIFTDNDGNPITTIVPNWTVDANSELQYQINVSCDENGNIKLKSLGGDENIGKSFVLKVDVNDDVHGFFEAQIEITLVSLF